MSANGCGGDGAEGIDKEQLADSCTGEVEVASQPTDQDCWYRRVPGKSPRHVWKDIHERDIAGGEGVEAGDAARGYLTGDKACCVLALDILRDGFADLLIDPVMATAKARPVVNPCQ